MPSDALILAFDTSAAHCAAALLSGSDIIAQRLEIMAKGQAERLVPLLEETLAEAGHDWADLTALAVGTGPGNFTGLRISVALARGLSLGLGIPAHGVTGFEAAALDRPLPVLTTLPAPRNQLYGQLWSDDGPGETLLFSADAVPQAFASPGLSHSELPENPACAMARVAALRGTPAAPPAPFYLRPADAAPPRDAPPRIIP